MSTLFRVSGRGKRLTYGMIQRLCHGNGFTLEKGKGGDLVICTPSGYVHLYGNTKRTNYNMFERFGGNSADDLIGALYDDYGYEVISEHEDNF